MSNMSYCRFQNTLNDLKDCHENIYNELSKEEHKARKRLIAICKDIAENVDEDDLTSEEDDE